MKTHAKTADTTRTDMTRSASELACSDPSVFADPSGQISLCPQPPERNRRRF